MIINTAKERSRRIFANVSSQEMTATGMFIEEISNIVYEACDNNQRSLFRFLEDCKLRVRITSY